MLREQCNGYTTIAETPYEVITLGRELESYIQGGKTIENKGDR